jgi:hypothetical protein
MSLIMIQTHIILVMFSIFNINICYIMEQTRNKLKLDESDKDKELISERKFNKKRKNKSKKIETFNYCYLHSIIYFQPISFFCNLIKSILCVQTIFWFFFCSNICWNHFLIFFCPRKFFLIICAGTFFYVSHNIDPQKKCKKVLKKFPLKKIFKNEFNLCCKRLILGFTRIQFFQHTCSWKK